MPDIDTLVGAFPRSNLTRLGPQDSELSAYAKEAALATVLIGQFLRLSSKAKASTHRWRTTMGNLRFHAYIHSVLAIREHRKLVEQMALLRRDAQRSGMNVASPRNVPSNFYERTLIITTLMGVFIELTEADVGLKSGTCKRTVVDSKNGKSRHNGCATCSDDEELVRELWNLYLPAAEALVHLSPGPAHR